MKGNSSAKQIYFDDREVSFAALEIACVTLSLLLVIWVALPLSNYRKGVAASFAVICSTYMLASHRIYRETRIDIGWRLDNFVEAVRWLAILSLPVITVLIIGSSMLRGSQASIDAETGKFLPTEWLTFSSRENFLWRIIMIFSGLAQQYVMQGFINRRAQIVFGRGWRSIFAVALIFGLLHLPHGWLMMATFIEGLGWAYVFQRAPNLFALALSHAIMTRLTIAFIPDHFLHGLRVGWKFYS